MTSTAQATMTDAEMKEADNPFLASTATRKSSSTQSKAEDAANAAASLREFTVVQGWWDSQVWTLRQVVRLDDPLKDPRPSSHVNSNSSYRGEAEVEAIVVALQEGHASSRNGAGRVSS